MLQAKIIAVNPQEAIEAYNIIKGEFLLDIVNINNLLDEPQRSIEVTVIYAGSAIGQISI